MDTLMYKSKFNFWQLANCYINARCNECCQNADKQHHKPSCRLNSNQILLQNKSLELHNLLERS